MPKDSFPKGINVAVAPKGWMNEAIMSELIDKIWRKKKNSFFVNPGDSILIYDSNWSHVTSNIKKIVEKYSKLVIIPGGLKKICSHSI